jgi:hypothetical protein
MDKEPRTLRSIIGDLYAQYQRDPHGWKMYVRKSTHGFGDIFVGTPQDELWQIKVDSLYKARPLGVGERLSQDRANETLFDESLPSYGFRGITSDELTALRQVSSKGGIRHVDCCRF